LPVSLVCVYLVTIIRLTRSWPTLVGGLALQKGNHTKQGIAVFNFQIIRKRRNGF
jgi:hypothetical protein